MTANACLICNLWHLTMPCDDEGSSSFSSAFLWPKQGGCLFVLQVVTLQMRLVPEESQCGHHPSAGAQLQGAANEACGHSGTHQSQMIYLLQQGTAKVIL